MNVDVESLTGGVYWLSLVQNQQLLQTLLPHSCAKSGKPPGVRVAGHIEFKYVSQKQCSITKSTIPLAHLSVVPLASGRFVVTSTGDWSQLSSSYHFGFCFIGALSRLIWEIKVMMTKSRALIIG